MHPFLTAAIGGLILGTAAALLLIGNGRIAGVSGISTRLFLPEHKDRAWRLAFVLGLIVAGIGAAFIAPGQFSTLGARPVALVIVAGLATGVGTALANGCTSGHGVCGIGRGSVRSIVATLTFMATAAVTVFIVRHL